MSSEPGSLFALDGRVAIVTGGRGLIGSRFVQALADAGARVAVFDSSEQTARGALELAIDGERLRSFVVDVTDKSSIAAALGTVVAEWGDLHVLVNAAAIDTRPDAPAEEVGPFEDFPEELFDRVMDVNVKGVLLMCQ